MARLIEVTVGTGEVPASYVQREDVGVPTGTDLDLDVGTGNETYGDVFLETPGMIYEDKLVHGVVFVRANNITIRRCRIRYGINGFNSGTHFSFTVEDSDLGANDDGSAPAGWRTDDGIKFQGYTMRRCRVEGFSDGAKANGAGTVIEDTWIRVWMQPGDHNDAIQNVGGAGDVTISGCNLDSRPVNDTSEPGNACLMSGDGPTDGTTTVTGCLLRGGTECLRLYDGGADPDLLYVVTGNTFDDTPPGAMGSPGGRGSTNVTPPGQVTWSGNVWLDDGSPVPAP